MAGGQSNSGQSSNAIGRDCPSEEIILQFVEGGIAATDQASLHAHLDQCSACRQLIVELTRATASEPAAPEPTVGQLVGKYRLEERLGQGGMGVVFRARDTQLGRAVALKFISAHSRGDPLAAARLTREARAASALEHPNVGAVLEIGHDQGHLFIAMALIEGVTLRQRLAQGPLPIDEAVAILRQLTAALAAAHAAGIVHRDIKPSNVMLTPSGTVKLFDFGLAKFLEAPAPEQSLTSTGQILGTVGYMAPELLTGKPLDRRADLWALGVVAYEMLVGVTPFRGETAPITVGRILSDAVDPPSRQRPEVPRQLDRLVMALLERPLHRRPGDAAVVERELAAMEAGRRSTRRWRRSWTVALAATLLVAVTGAALRSWSVQRTHARALASPPRRASVAVLGLVNGAGDADAAWLSTAIGEMLTRELSTGEALRSVPAEDVARIKRDLALTDSDGYAPATLARVRRALDADYVVSGTYLAAQPGSDGSLELKLALQDARSGATTTFTERGDRAHLVALVSRAGRAILGKLVGERAVADARTAAPLTLPAQPEALRAYSDGIRLLGEGELLAARERLEHAVSIEPRYTQAHAALAQVWSGLGYDARAKSEAQIAFENSSDLSREERLLVEARYREMSHDWANAIDIYRALVRFFPDEVDYGIGLAQLQNAASKPKSALETLAMLRRLPAPSGDDPRIDLEETASDDVLGDERAELAAAQRAANKGRALGSRALVGRAQIAAGWALRNLGEHARAVAAIDEARAIFGQLADRDGLGYAIHTWGTILYSQGDVGAAIEKEREALALLRTVGDQKKIAIVLNSIACDHEDAGELEQARDEFRQVLALAREIEAPSEVALALVNLGSVDINLAAFDDARAVYREALPVAHEIGDRIVEGSALWGQGEIARLTGDLPAAKRELDEAMRFAHATPNDPIEAVELEALASILFEQAQLSAARATYERAIASQSADPLPPTLGRLGLAEVALAEGRAGDAEQLARAAAAALAAQGRWSTEARAWAIVADSALARGDLAAARDALGHAQPTQIARLLIDDRMRVTMAAARATARAGQADAALAQLRANLAAAERAGLAAQAFETRLVLGEIEKSSGRKEARAHLAALHADAAGSGFVRIAARAKRLGAERD